MSKKILIFCDPGIDDTIALLLAFFIDEIEIVGIVADYGNVPKEMAVQNAHFLKQKSRNRDMKIFGGSDRPLNGGPEKLHLVPLCEIFDDSIVECLAFLIYNRETKCRWCSK